LEKAVIIKTFALASLISLPIGFFYFFIGPEFEIGITQFWGRIDREKTEIKTIVSINNPTHFARWLKRIEFDLYMNGFKIANEAMEKSIEVKPMGRTEISLTSFLDNSKITDLWIIYLNKGNLFDLELTGNVTFSSKIREIILPIGYKISTHTNLLELLDIKKQRDITVGTTALTLKSLTLTWGEVSSAQTEINNRIVIYNPNSYQVTIKEINYTIMMNHIKMGEGILYNPIVLEAKTETNISFPAILNNSMLDEWWATHLRNDQITRISVKVDGIAEISGTEYDFIIAEVEGEASIRILGATISMGYYLPVL
jgi:LEA14-like dessication related protein